MESTSSERAYLFSWSSGKSNYKKVVVCSDPKSYIEKTFPVTGKKRFANAIECEKNSVGSWFTKKDPDYWFMHHEPGGHVRLLHSHLSNQTQFKVG